MMNRETDVMGQKGGTGERSYPSQSRTLLTRLELGQHDPSLSTLVRLAKALRVSVTELLGETMSMRQWWQVGQDRFTTREDAEDHACTAGGCLSHGIRTSPEARCAVSSCSWDEIITAHAVSFAVRVQGP